MKLWVIEAGRRGAGGRWEDKLRVFDDPWDVRATLRWLRDQGFKTYHWRL